MNSTLRKDADAIIASSLNAVLPDKAVRRALKAFAPKGGRVLLVAAGKAAWQMAHAAVETLGRVDGGVVVTKYGHVKGEIPGVTCYEAGHPVPDENGFAATQKALELVQGLEQVQAWVQELACYCHRSNHLNCSAELPLYCHCFHCLYCRLPESPQNRRHLYCRYLHLPSLRHTRSRSRSS